MLEKPQIHTAEKMNDELWIEIRLENWFKKWYIYDEMKNINFDKSSILGYSEQNVHICKIKINVFNSYVFQKYLQVC